MGHSAQQSGAAPDAMPLVYVVVLNWNKWRMTADCLQSLGELDYPNYRVLVVDNGSSDDSFEELAALYPEQEIIVAKANLGFAGGNNLGIKRALKAGAEFVWLLNNDAFPLPGALRAMVALAMDQPALGAVGSVLLDRDPPHKVQAWGGGRISLTWGRARHVKTQGEARRLDYLIGASLLLRSAALDQTGLLDEGFFLYWEDADLCLRLRKAGWGLAVAGDSVVYHQGNASLEGRGCQWAQFYARSSRRFFLRHAARPLIPIWCGGFLRMASALLKGRWPVCRGMAQGLRAAEPGPNYS